ncbi:MAG: hypothetical protein M3P30_03135 [Chloroflexota bacterium]|nr:hypothetical protein [Chloroflexota bacterium]
MRKEGKLTNAEGEFIASGPCEVNSDRGEVTMWPSWEMHMLERERGELVLELDDLGRFVISDKHLTFKLQGPAEQRISVYRLRIIEQVPEHLSASFAAPALPEAPQQDIDEEPGADLEPEPQRHERAPIEWPRR